MAFTARSRSAPRATCTRPTLNKRERERARAREREREREREKREIQETCILTRTKRETYLVIDERIKT